MRQGAPRRLTVVLAPPHRGTRKSKLFFLHYRFGIRMTFTFHFVAIFLGESAASTEALDRELLAT